jgi:hypothetical protein
MTVPVQPTVPAPDIQQPIARYDATSTKWMCDPVWYRFFRSPQFTAASIGGGVGGGSGQPVAPPSPVMTGSNSASSTLQWLSWGF